MRSTHPWSNATTPRSADEPVIVGGTGGRGVVAAASYEVRRFGVHSAMPVREALRRCPDAICVPPRIAHYAAVSQPDLRDLPRVHSARAGLVAGRGISRRHGEHRTRRCERIAREIDTLVRERTELTASVGVAPNKLVAKIASDLRKPDGLVVVRADEVRELLDPLPIRKLFGLGAKTAPKVEALGIHTLGELRDAQPSRLRPIFGRYTERVQQRAAGIDDRPVIPDRTRSRSAPRRPSRRTSVTTAPARGDGPPGGQGLCTPTREAAVGALRHREDPARRFYDVHRQRASSRRRRRRAW